LKAPCRLRGRKASRSQTEKKKKMAIHFRYER
jgi:hypothetical protein